MLCHNMLPKVYRLKQKCGGVVTGSPICIHAESGIAKRMRERERERQRERERDRERERER